MKKTFKAFLVMAIVFVMAMGPVAPYVYGAEGVDSDVQAVTEQLEAIDTLQQMQDKRNEYKVKNNHYDVNTTSETVITEHETVRADYEAYISKMFAARAAAQQAYDELSAEQQAQIDSALVAKLGNTLDTVFNSATYAVTPADDEYTFEAVKGGPGYGYEVSNHMVMGNIPQTFILVDTSDGKTEWTPSGKYVQGESNYEVAYCCDVLTALSYTTDYKRTNLEDAGYYSEESAKHIRGILENSYPFVTIDEMKAKLIANGMDKEFVDELTRSDIISAVQMAVWAYANNDDGIEDGFGYFASISITKNQSIYFYALHDTNNENWNWLPGKRQRSFDARAQYRVNNLAYYLCGLEAKEADDDQIVISDIELARAQMTLDGEGVCQVGMYAYLNNGGSEKDDMKITAVSYSENEDGTKNVTDRASYRTNGSTKYEFNLKAKYGDTIKVYVEGTQYISKGVYFYEPEGGRDVSQSLVGVSKGETAVYAEKEFEFKSDINRGLRIYKTATDTKLPIEGITFDVYEIPAADAGLISESATEEEINKYAVEANLVGSVTTDSTGYAALELDYGTYMVVEQANAKKVVAPVAPFYIAIPGSADADTEIVSVYPKNTPVKPPEEPPVIPPPPADVTGQFTIIKHDSTDVNRVLEGAEFKVYKPVDEAGLLTKTIECDGVEYAVEAVEVDGKDLVLTSGADGSVTSPELPCGTYFLEETKAPTGYYILGEAVEVTVTSNLLPDADPVYIANDSGAMLPSTGGFGTVMMYLIGATLVLLAGVMLVMRRRAYN